MDCSMAQSIETAFAQSVLMTTRKRIKMHYAHKTEISRVVLKPGAAQSLA